MAKSLQARRYRRLPMFLRQLREKAGITQRELGQRLGIQHTMIHNSETAERRVDVAEFADWAKACGEDPVKAFKDFLKSRLSNARNCFQQPSAARNIAPCVALLKIIKDQMPQRRVGA